MKKVVILGAGFAGLHIFYKLRELINKQIELTIIDAKKYSLLKPSLPEVALEGTPLLHSLVELEHTISAKGGRFLQDSVTAIDPHTNTITLESGKEENYDYLFITLGAVKDYQQIKGYDKFGYSVCDDKEARKLWERVKAFKGGKIVIGAAKSHFGNCVDAPKLNAPCEGPIGEVMFMLDHYLKKEKSLHNPNDYTIDIFTPSEIFFEDVGNNPRKAISTIMQERNMKLHTSKVLQEIKANEVVFEDDSTLLCDLAIIIPPYTAPKCVQTIGDDAGFIPTDTQMRHLDYRNIFCAGDLNALAQPKLGHIAIIQASIASATFQKELGIDVEIPKYKPEIFCIMNMGGHDATLIYSDVLYGGDKDIVIHSALAKMMKWSFDNYLYYNKGHIPPDILLEATNKFITLLK